MDFKKRLKTRLILAIIYILSGIALISLSIFSENEFISSFGLVVFVIGIARLVQNKRITKNAETLKKREIAETDERNVMLWTKARSMAFSVYILLSAFAIVVLNILNMNIVADVIAYSLFGFFVIYWICYFIIRLKN